MLKFSNISCGVENDKRQINAEAVSAALKVNSAHESGITASATQDYPNGKKDHHIAAASRRARAKLQKTYHGTA